MRILNLLSYIKTLILLLFPVLLFSFSCNEKQKNETSEIISSPQEKKPVISEDSIHKQITETTSLYDTIMVAGDWMSIHPEEKFLSFEDYKKKKPERITDERYKIYIQPIGEFDSVRTSVLNITADYLHAFFGTEVVINKMISDSLVPDDERRMMHGNEQLKSSFINKKLLKPDLPADAAVMVGFTQFDLYPSDDWNFVFGQALSKGRVGVWSVNRFGFPEINKKEYRNFLMRALRTSSHEISHMFSLPHCVKYKCALNGANSLEEADTRPMWLCPECLKKLSWNFNQLPSEHYKRMKEFWAKQGENEFSGFYENNLERIND